jgi:hypothetical protein
MPLIALAVTVSVALPCGSIVTAGLDSIACIPLEGSTMTVKRYVRLKPSPDAVTAKVYQFGAIVALGVMVRVE